MDQIGAIPGLTQQDLDAGPLGTEGAQELEEGSWCRHSAAFPPAAP